MYEALIRARCLRASLATAVALRATPTFPHSRRVCNHKLFNLFLLRAKKTKYIFYFFYGATCGNTMPNSPRSFCEGNARYWPMSRATTNRRWTQPVDYCRQVRRIWPTSDKRNFTIIIRPNGDLQVSTCRNAALLGSVSVSS